MGLMENEITALVEEIRKLSHGYKPGASVSNELSKKVTVPIVGPFAIGKSTLMRRVAELDEEFSYVLGFTTRDRRTGEPDGIYRYPGHSVESLTEIRDQLLRGDLVQAFVHPTTDYIYGSDLVSYSSSFNILDVFSNAIQEFEVLPFKDLRTIYVVTPLETWQKWLPERMRAHDAHDIQKRWEEAVISLRWGLEHVDSIGWVINEDGNLDTVCDKIITNVRRKSRGDSTKGPLLAEAMLEHALASKVG